MVQAAQSKGYRLQQGGTRDSHVRHNMHGWGEGWSSGCGRFRSREELGARGCDCSVIQAAQAKGCQGWGEELGQEAAICSKVGPGTATWKVEHGRLGGRLGGRGWGEGLRQPQRREDGGRDCAMQQGWDQRLPRGAGHEMRGGEAGARG